MVAIVVPMVNIISVIVLELFRGQKLQLGLRGADLVPYIIMCASPTAVSSYTMAESMGGDGKLASQLVFYSTAVSIATIFVIRFITKSMGLLKKEGERIYEEKQRKAHDFGIASGDAFGCCRVWQPERRSADHKG